MSVRSRSSRRLETFGETVFTTYTRLAEQYGAVNLGQGFPDFTPPEFALSALREAAEGSQQYAPLPGVPELTGAVAETMSARLGRDVTAPENVQITVGATEALFAAMQAFIDPGDEVVVLEPFYDAYPADVLMAGGVPRFVPLLPQGGEWVIDEDALRAAATVPAKVAQRPDLGRLAPGAPADVVVLDDRLEVVRVLVEGRDRVAR